MRTAFINTLTALAKNDPSVMLLTGDLGFSVFENFRDTFPKQYLNAGVSEQNMIGVAAGLAKSGRTVFAYSIVPFATFRCLEQIRDDLCYHRLRVCVVGVGGGYSYGYLGSTHHALEDIAVMRSLPNMTVICPGDPRETEAAVRAIHAAGEPGPWYLRLGKNGEPVVHAAPLEFRIGKAMEMKRGTDATLISTSTMLPVAMEASAMLGKSGIHAGVLSMHTVKPLDEDAIGRAARTQLIVTLEEHSAIGGLGGAVAESLARQSLHAALLVCAASDAFAPVVGSQEYLRREAGLTAETVCQKVLEASKQH